MSDHDELYQLLWEEKDLKNKIKKFKHAGVMAVISELHKKGFFRASLRDKVLKLEKVVRELEEFHQVMKRAGQNTANLPKKAHDQLEKLQSEIEENQLAVLKSLQDLERLMRNAKANLLEFLAKENAINQLLNPNYKGDYSELEKSELLKLQKLNTRLNMRLMYEVQELFAVLADDMAKLHKDLDNAISIQIQRAQSGAEGGAKFDVILSELDLALKYIDDTLRDAEREKASILLDEKDARELVEDTSHLIKIAAHVLKDAGA